MESSIAYNNGCYSLEREEYTPNKYDMTEKRLHSLEKWLLREPKIAEEYKRIIHEHLEKGYVTKLYYNQHT